MAIIAIALHNYCHFFSFTVKENESSFSKQYPLDFFKASEFSYDFIYDIFSFLGWYGVPVFIFLSGYGLVRKYETPNGLPMHKPSFLLDNWFKLFALLLPGVLFFIGEDIWHFFHGGGFDYLKNIKTQLILLTFLNDAFAPWLGIRPGIYWYFGLTLEFYFLYALVLYRRSVKVLLLVTLASILLQLAIQYRLFGNTQPALWWCRQNITGWMLPFAFGNLYARAKSIPTFWIYISVCASIILFFPMMLDPALWQISLLCSIVLFITVSHISLKIPYWQNLWIYIGRLSPFIFASHAITRTYFYKYLSPENGYIGLKFMAYIIAIFLSSIVYKAVWSLLTPKFRICLDKIFSIKNYQNI